MRRPAPNLRVFLSLFAKDGCCDSNRHTKNSLASLHQPGAATAPRRRLSSALALWVDPLARSGSASRYPHALSVRTAVFVNGRIMSVRFRPAVLRFSCSSQDRRAVWRASGRSRWRSAATASRRRSMAAPMGSATVTGSGCRGMSQSSLGAMVACDGRSLAGPTHLSAVCKRRSTDRSRSTACILGQTMRRVSPPSGRLTAPLAPIPVSPRADIRGSTVSSPILPVPGVETARLFAIFNG